VPFLFRYFGFGSLIGNFYSSTDSVA
jgi:hypothetical protein